MTDTQLYLAIGVPMLFNGLMFTVLALYLHSISNRLDRMEDRLHNLIGAVNELDKRIIKIEFKLGIES